MSHTGDSFFTAVGCMDGRVQEVIAEFGREKFHAQYPDTVTEAGLVGQLAKEEIDPLLAAGITTKVVAVSLEKHHSQGIIVHGHQECAGNPVSDEQQKEDIKKATDVISSLVRGKAPVVGVFVKRSVDNPTEWIVEQI